jgi:hypothetical protein
MSIGSKAKRDARMKKARPAARRPPLPITPHAQLRDGQDQVIGGAGLRGSEWVLVMDGEVLAGTESPGMILAMLSHAANLRQESGETIHLTYSDLLRDAATSEAASAGKTLEQLLDFLEQERLEHAEEKRSGIGQDLPP